MNTMQVERFFCICNDYNDRCWQLGGIHYIILPEVEVEDGKPRAKPFDFRIEVSEIKQKDRKFWVGGHSAMNLDLLSNVPQVEDEKQQSELAVELSKKDGYDNYQRKLNRTRVDSFGKFWENPENSLVNGITLATNYAPATGEKAETDIIFFDEESRELIISSRFLGGECDDCNHSVYDQLKSVLDLVDVDEYPDKHQHVTDLISKVEDWRKKTNLPYSNIRSFHCLNPECKSKGNKNHHTTGISQDHKAKSKPFSILDGQHRVKGSQMAKPQGEEKNYCLTCDKPEFTQKCSNANHKQELALNNFHREAIPFTLVSEGYGGFPDEQQGKLFAQITTEAKPLETDHLRYMSWRFNMEHEGANFTTESTTRDDICYRVLLELAQDGLLSNRFRLLGELKTGNADEDVLRDFYVVTPKKLFELIKYADNHYFRHIKKNYYDGSPERVTQYADAIKKYFTALEESHFQHPENKIWSTDSQAAVSGVRNTGASNPKGSSSVWFKTMFFLMTDVFREVAIDQYLSENPARGPGELATDKPHFNRLPHTFSHEEIMDVLSYLPGLDFGVTDGMDHNFLGSNEETIYGLVKQLITKPVQLSQEKSDLLTEIDEIGGA